MYDLSLKLIERQKAFLYRNRRTLEGATETEIIFDGKKVINFCSNDYLGLANHPLVVEAFITGVRRYGVGAGASHLISGHRTAHHLLEEELAAFLGRPRALLFSSGYLANLGVITALFGRHDYIYADRLNHASLIDAARYSGARCVRYPHNNINFLNEALSRSSSISGQKLIVTDGVFSMDGDLAQLPELTALTHQHAAWLMVDDAHGIGVIGNGRGTLSHYGLKNQDIPILIGTLGKAFGTAGAFVAGSAELIETLIQEARTYIYTTATPPAVAEATRAALRIIDQESWRRDQLSQLIKQLRTGLADLPVTLMPSITPIQPLILGTAQRALTISTALLARGFLVSAIRPPTVPEGTARLRITLTSTHNTEHVNKLIDALADCLNLT